MKLSLGENIRKYRKRIDWTQDQLADRLGVSPQSVSRWESGNGYPDMEHLPTLARLFSVTMDDLIGYGEPEERLDTRQLHDRMSDAVRREDPDAAAELLRKLRFEYMDDLTGAEILPLVNLNSGKLNESPRFMEELRLFAEEYLEHGRQMHIREYLFTILTHLEDDVHFRKTVNRYSHQEQTDLSMSGLLMKRAYYRNDTEAIRILRSVKNIARLNAYFSENGERIFYKQWQRGWKEVPADIENDPELPADDPTIWRDDSERKLTMLHAFSGVTPDETHPVSGNGILDMWGAVRVQIGLYYAAQLSACGDHDRALTVLEDCVSLIEQARELPPDAAEIWHRKGGYKRDEFPEVPYTAPEIEGIRVYRIPTFSRGADAPPEINFECTYCAFGMSGRPIFLGMIGFWPLTCLTEQQIPREGFRSGWFNPIRNHPRYLAVTERIRQCEK